MKNIIICFDGTGNEFRARKNTNVVKIYQAINKNDPGKQIAFYDPGVGTISAPGIQFPLFKFLSKLMGLAFGYGFSRNVSDAYIYLMNQYESGDRIYLFGFSRGAYTVRALAGMLRMCGLLNKDSENLVPYALKVYKHRKRKKPKGAKGFWTWFYCLLYIFWRRQPDWARAAGFKKTFCRKCPVYFIGVWDTVKAIGWFRRRIILPYTFFSPEIKFGCHAVSIDEKRSQYRTNLWGYKNSDDFKEVWFAGAHADIGGSYEETDLSDITLKWMMYQAGKKELNIDGDYIDRLKPFPLGKLHNPLLPFWWILGWRKRKITKKIKIGVKAYKDYLPVPWIHRNVDIRRQGIKSYQPKIPDQAVFID